MQAIGHVKFVQIQTRPLKVNEDHEDSYYDPIGIQRVSYLRLLPEGAIGVTEDGLNVVDIHNSLHVHHRSNGRNALSMGFSAHYDIMQAHFGPQVALGSAGENIIIQSAPFPATYVGRQLAIESCATQKMTYFTVTRPVAPCQHFSKFCTQNPHLNGAAMKETLQFLGDGRRGMMLALTPDQGRVIVQTDDKVYLVDG
jgi:MOSC domain-containing protein YiiM